MINEKTSKKLIVLAFIAFLAVLTIIILWPLILSIIAGLILAYIFYPVYTRILKVVREKNISALILVLLIIFILFIPVWFLFPMVSRQIFDVYSYSQKVDISGLLKGILPETISKDSVVIINNFISKVVGSLFSTLSNTLLNIPTLLLKAVVALFVFFFAMRDGEKLKGYLKSISPFSAELEKSLSRQFKDMTSSVIYGQIIVGVIQGILTGVGLFIFGVPQTLLLTLLAIFLAMLPIIGAWLIWVPASIYLLIKGNVGAGIGLFLYGAIFVSWIDNIIRPYIVARKTKMNSGIILIGMIGGLIIFGPLGLILGPLILSYLLIILDAYRNKKLNNLFSS